MYKDYFYNLKNFNIENHTPYNLRRNSELKFQIPFKFKIKKFDHLIHIRGPEMFNSTVPSYLKRKCFDKAISLTLFKEKMQDIIYNLKKKV